MIFLEDFRYSFTFNVHKNICHIVIFFRSQNVKRCYREALLIENPQIQAAVKNLYDYFYDYWIDEVTPEVYSVCGLPNRTNNLVEAWHRWFNKRCRTSHVNIWDFIRKFYSIGQLRYIQIYSHYFYLIMSKRLP